MNTFLDIRFFLQHLQYSPALVDDINKVLQFFPFIIPVSLSFSVVPTVKRTLN